MLIVLILIGRHHSRIRSALKKLDIKDLQAVEALKDQILAFAFHDTSYLERTFEHLKFAHQCNSSDLWIVEADFLGACELSFKADYAYLKESKHWSGVFLNNFGSVKKEYKDAFRRQYETKRKLTIEEQQILLHKAIDEVYPTGFLAQRLLNVLGLTKRK